MANNAIGQCAIACAWPLNTPESKTKYKTGTRYGQYTKALHSAYPDRSSWGARPRAGASCDVFVGTCVRYSTADNKFPRGLSEQKPYLNKHTNKWKKLSSDAKIQGGDVQLKKNNGHIRIVVEIKGKKYIANAHYKHKKYGIIENYYSGSSFNTYRCLTAPDNFLYSGEDNTILKETQYYSANNLAEDPTLEYVTPALDLLEEMITTFTDTTSLVSNFNTVLENLNKVKTTISKKDLVSLYYTPMLTTLNNNSSNTNVVKYYNYIKNRITALEMSIEAEEKNIDLFQTSVYTNAKSVITTKYETQLKQAGDKISAIQNKLYNLDLTNYTSEITTINNTISTINNQIAELQQAIKRKNKNFYVLEDMITDYETQKNKANLSLSNFKTNNFSDEYAYWNKNVITNPAVLNFWIEFLDTEGELSQFNIRTIGDRSKVVNEDKASAIYFKEIPSLIFVSGSDERTKYTKLFTGYNIVNIPSSKQGLFTISSQGQSIKELLDEDLYNYGYCAEEINLTTIPIYYLEPGQIITVYDKTSNINGKYVISKISSPLTYNGNMTITATKVPLKLY